MNGDRTYLQGMEDAARVCDLSAVAHNQSGVINPIVMGRLAEARELARQIRSRADQAAQVQA